MIISEPRNTRSPRFTIECKQEKRGKGISFRDQHRQDATMVPDRGFTKQLKALDPELEVLWNWLTEKWAIWSFPKGREPYHVMTIESKGKSYRELGQDVLIHLTEINSQRYESKNILAYLDEHNRQVQRRKMKDFRNKIDAIARDTFNYAQGILQVAVPQSYRIEEVLK
jgi:hypothetical protein